ncbi:hypothetical protein MASR2M39_29830 [Ignavibacteriales bacterium]
MNQQVVVIFTDDALGSGFILNSEGYVATNSHVVDGAERVYIKFQDSKEFYTATVEYIFDYKENPESNIAISCDLQEIRTSNYYLGDKRTVSYCNWFGATTISDEWNN